MIVLTAFETGIPDPMLESTFPKVEPEPVAAFFEILV
jgi:hypothetical protein